MNEIITFATIAALSLTVGILIGKAIGRRWIQS
jgi:hypothetical protein